MDFDAILDRQLEEAAHLNGEHVHPKLLKMFQLAGMDATFVRGHGQYLWDAHDTRYLDFLSGGGAHFLGRNHPGVNAALISLLGRDLANLTVVNPALLSGLVAQRLLELAGPGFSKVIFANTGSETTEVCVRFARYVTRRRRFLYLEGAFHGRSYAAVSLCGSPALREGQDPLMPTCTPLRRNDLKQLRQELRMGDVAALVVEPVQGMTCEATDRAWLREAQLLCEEHGTLLVADEVQTGLGRTGSWFASTAMGVRPSMMTVSKTLSGGQVPVGAVLVSDEVYQRVFSTFTSGPFYFSTFAENNLAMAAALATLDGLAEIDAPARAAALGEQLRHGVETLARRYDCIERFAGRGLMACVYFRPSASSLRLRAEQAALAAADPGAFGAAVHVELYRKHKILVQIPGPGLDAVKILPPVCTTQDDVRAFLDALDDTLGAWYDGPGPAAALVRTSGGALLGQAAAALPTTGFAGAMRALLTRPTSPPWSPDAPAPAMPKKSSPPTDTRES
ncbi:MAG: aspartate aminotransferase family protein [Pseudomonadota bacterium]|nr:aspartate aminotransferase family protein [Pseudomonadota bacterium]